jgi:hypothetical protein
MSDVNSAMNALRRRLVGRSGAVENRAIDDLRLVASSAGGGVAGLETLMILASIADGGSSLDPQTRVLQARLARRDPKVADLVMKLGTAMFKNHGQLLRSEENRLKHGATAGLLRANMPATEQGQYGLVACNFVNWYVADNDERNSSFGCWNVSSCCSSALQSTNNAPPSCGSVLHR